MVLELVGTATFESSLKSLGRGGRVVTVGLHRVSALSANAKDFTQNEWEVIGSRNVTKRELVEVVQLVGTGRVRPIVTGVFPLTEAEVIHARLRKQEFVGRVVLEP